MSGGLGGRPAPALLADPPWVRCRGPCPFDRAAHGKKTYYRGKNSVLWGTCLAPPGTSCRLAFGHLAAGNGVGAGRAARQGRVGAAEAPGSRRSRGNRGRPRQADLRAGAGGGSLGAGGKGAGDTGSGSRRC